MPLPCPECDVCNSYTVYLFTARALHHECKVRYRWLSARECNLAIGLRAVGDSGTKIDETQGVSSILVQRNDIE